MSVDLSKYTSVRLQLIIDNKEKLIETNTPVMRLNRDGILVVVSMSQVEKLYDNVFAEKDESEHIFYIRSDYKTIFNDVFNISKYDNNEEKKQVGKSDEKMKYFSTLDKCSKRTHLSKLKERIRDILKTDTLDKEGAAAITDAFTDANMITKVTLLDNLKDQKNMTSTEAIIKNGTSEITQDVTNLMKDILTLMEKNTETRALFDSMKDDSDNDAFKHSNRVCMMYTSFLLYYNNAINNGIVNRVIRRRFTPHYLKYYEAIFKKFNIKKDINHLEDVVERGMSVVTKNNIVLYSMACLIHDIGKSDDIDNFNADSGMTNMHSESHLFSSYNIVRKAAEYPPDVVAIVGYHHEYYGNGYGPFGKMYKEKIKLTPDFEAKYALTYDLTSINNCSALGYFPAKILEIVDVYDSLLYPLGRKIITGSQKRIMELMRDKFIENPVSLDPILFDIFVDYIQKIEDKEDFSHIRTY